MGAPGQHAPAPDQAQAMQRATCCRPWEPAAHCTRRCQRGAWCMRRWSALCLRIFGLGATAAAHKAQGPEEGGAAVVVVAGTTLVQMG